MKKLLLLTYIAFCTAFYNTNAQITFQKIFGGDTTYEWGRSAQQTIDGGYIITGYTNSFGAGQYDVYLVKIDSIGNVLWTKTYGGNSDDYGRVVEQTSDGQYFIAGGTSSFGTGGVNIYLLKINVIGDTLWTKTYGGANSDYCRSAQQTVDGGYIITGYTNSFGAGLNDVYLVKIDSTGNVLWSKTFGGSNNDVGYSVQQTTDGGYIITGSTFSFGAGSQDVYLIKTNVNGDVQWTKTYGGTISDIGYSVQQTADGGYIVTGFTSSFGSGTNDIYLIKTDSNGDTLWTKFYGGSIHFHGESINQTDDGGYIIAGWTALGPNNNDIYLLKVDSIGDTVWTRTYGNIDSDAALSVQQTMDGGYAIIGGTTSFGAGDGDVYFIKTDANGNSGGCNEYYTATMVGSTATQVGGGYIAGSGGIVSSTSTIVTTPPTQVNLLCSNFPCDTLILSFTTQNPTCNGISNGSASVTVSGGNPPYTYIWSTSDTTDSISSLTAGTYTLTVTDTNGCTSTDSIIISEPIQLNISLSTTFTTCGTATAIATATVTGGTLPYAYQWSSGDSTATADSLSSGIYIVSVTDSNGCTTFAAATISDAGGPVISNIFPVDVKCNGGSDGAIAIIVSGGAPPYSYLWSNGATSTGISDLVAGPYEITVTDDSGCVANATIIVNEPVALNISVTTTDAACGAATATATATVSGGTSPYNYLWSTGSTTDTVSGLTAGIYAVSITDDNNCTDSSIVTISEAGGPVITIDSVNDAGCAGAGGSIYITVSGDAAPFTYLWSDSSVNEVLTNAGAGAYYVTVTDTNNCIATASASIAGVLPDTATICMVTVDSATGYNLIVWEKQAGQGIAAYNIWRESTIAGLYYLAGTVPYDSLSAFIDTLSNPEQRAYRYKISVIDSCGNGSELSELHKTMHLTINEGMGSKVNLIWDHYEGYPVFTYFIWRYRSSTGWEKIDSMPANLTSYTDNTPPAANLWYRIEVPHPAGCQPTFLSNAITLSDGIANAFKVLQYNSAKSNVTNRLLPTGISNPQGFQNLAGLNVYPNPYTGKTEITYVLKIKANSGWIKNRSNGVNVLLEVYNILGEKVQVLVKGVQVSGKYRYSFSAKEQGYYSGVYILKLIVGDGVYTKQLVEF